MPSPHQPVHASLSHSRLIPMRPRPPRLYLATRRGQRRAVVAGRRSSIRCTAQSLTFGRTSIVDAGSRPEAAFGEPFDLSSAATALSGETKGRQSGAISFISEFKKQRKRPGVRRCSGSPPLAKHQHATSPGFRLAFMRSLVWLFAVSCFNHAPTYVQL